MYYDILRRWAFRLAALATLSPVMGAVDFQKEGGNLLAGFSEWTADRGTVTKAEGALILNGPAEETSTFRLNVPVEAGAEYFFSARTKSADRVVFFLGGLAMSYHRQGDWQTVCGLVRSNTKNELELRVQLRGLAEGAPAAELQDLVLQKVLRPQTVESRTRDGATALVRGGAVQAVIVSPAGHAEGAERIRAAIRDKTGVDVPIVADTEATEKDYPILRPEFREKNLIILGRLSTNRALWASYTRFLSAEDGYYPGGNGFVVRTAANVFGNGHNHLILGGSSNEGVDRAVARFVKLVEEAEKGADLIIPWTLEVELGGQCLHAFEEDAARWNTPDHPLLPAQTSGYGKVVRWYQNAMGYYWSGRKDYLERSKTYLAEILSERAHTHHYIVEFFIRTYDMLDDSPVFTGKEIDQLDSLVLQNFLDFLTVTDLNWMGVFSPPYEELRIINRHQLAPWYADLQMARFLQRNVVLSGYLKELVDFRLSEKESMFNAVVASRNGPSLPGIAASSDFEEFPAMFFRYALENDRYQDFVGSGLAHQTLSLARLDHTVGRYAFPHCAVDLPIWLGAMAHLTKDGRYQWLADNITYTGHELGPFQGRYVANVHRYQPGEDIKGEEPGEDWAGIQILPQPHREDQTEELTRTRFPLLSLRGGFQPKDDFLVVAGQNPSMPSGTLVSLIIRGISVFGGTRDDRGSESSRVTTNGASGIRLNGYQIGGSTKEGDSPCEIEWSGQFPGVWSVGIKTRISPDLSWTRAIVRLSKDSYLFGDTFTALKAGEYLLRVGWQPLSGIKPVDGGWQMLTRNGSIRIEHVGPGFDARQQGQSLAWEAVSTLKTGESVTTWTLVQAVTSEHPLWVAEAEGSEQVRLTQKGREPVVVHRGPLETSSGLLDAQLTVRNSVGAAVFGWTAGSDKSSRSVFLSSEGKVISADSRHSVEPSETWLPAISQALEKPAGEIPSETSPSHTRAIEDRVKDWKVDWTYDGLLRPKRMAVSQIAPGIFDLGRLGNLAEIRTVSAARIWKTGHLPEKLWVAPESASGAPEAESEEWILLSGKKISRPGAKTGNYGESTPVAHVDESLFVQDVKTRFIKAPGADALQVFVNDERVARHPVGLDVLRDLPGTQEPLLLARTEVFPAFPRPFRDDDFALAILDPKHGRPLAEIEVPGPVQTVLVADQKGNGEAEIFVLKADVEIEVYSLRGERREPVGLFEQFRQFEKQHGRSNTRGPAGGHYMPFAMGFWRPDEKGARKIVVSRYGSHAFLDENRRLEGVLAFHAYGSPGMLPFGVDFDGDGKEEILTLERSNLIHTGGDPNPSVRNAGGDQFWPQVYEQLAVVAPKDGGSNLLSGPPIMVFDVLQQWSGKPRFVAVVRSNYVGIYDGQDRKWNMSWRPPAPISAAAVVRETAERLEVNLTTVDGLWWTVILDSRRPGRPAVSIELLSLDVREINASPLLDGSAVIAAAEGLFLRKPDGTLTRIANGSYQSAVMITPDRIAAATESGSVNLISPRSSDSL